MVGSGEQMRKPDSPWVSLLTGIRGPDYSSDIG